jgi:hypothetical protein
MHEEEDHCQAKVLQGCKVSSPNLEQAKNFYPKKTVSPYITNRKVWP